MKINENTGSETCLIAGKWSEAWLNKRSGIVSASKVNHPFDPSFEIVSRCFLSTRTDSQRCPQVPKRWLTSLLFIRCLRLSQSAAWKPGDGKSMRVPFDKRKGPVISTMSFCMFLSLTIIDLLDKQEQNHPDHITWPEFTHNTLTSTLQPTCTLTQGLVIHLLKSLNLLTLQGWKEVRDLLSLGGRRSIVRCNYHQTKRIIENLAPRHAL